jgi:hypothetical protein
MKSWMSFSLFVGAMLLLAVNYHAHVPAPVVAREQAIATVTGAPPEATPDGADQPTTAASPAMGSDRTVAAVTLTEATENVADAITRLLRSGSAVERDRALHQLLPRLMARDPGAAVRLALAWEPGATQEELFRLAVHYWSEADIAGALTWATSVAPPEAGARAEAAAVAQVAQADPAGALDLAQVLQIGLADGSFEHRAQIWTEDDPAAAMAWVKAQPVGPLRDRLLARIAWVRAQSEPAEAADLVLNHMQPGELQTQALLATVRHWAVREPAEAAEWIAHFPAGRLRESAEAEFAWAAAQR